MLDGDQVVRAAPVQPFGVLALCVQCVRRDQDLAEVADLAEQAGEHGDFVGLAVDGDLGEHDPGAMVEAGQQVRCGTASIAGTAHGLAVNRHHRPRSWPPPGRELRGHPRPDRAVEGGRIDRGQHPPDRGQVRDRAGQAQPDPQPGRGVGGPLGDRRIRPCPGQHRAHRGGQDRNQRVPAAARVPRVGNLPERCQQALRRGPRQRHLGTCEQGKLAAGQHGRRRWHGRHGSRRRSRSWQNLMITAGPCLLT